MISQHEIDLGLALHLDPDELQICGATYSCQEGARVKGNHFFLCIGADDFAGLWLPLYTNSGVGRTKLSAPGRTGHPKWTQGTFHYHLGQIWTASHYAAVRAASAGGDLSIPGSRNRLAEQWATVVAQEFSMAVAHGS